MWFGWTDWIKTTFRTGGQIVAILLVFFFGGKLETFLDNIYLVIAGWIFGILIIPTILFLTYNRASNKLYQNQKKFQVAQEKEKEKLHARVKRLQKSQDKKEALKYYDDIEIYYERLAETHEEMRASYQTHTSTDDKRLPYAVKNLGDVTIKECCIRMMELKVIENLSTNEGAIIERPEDKLIEWKNSDKERINLGFRSLERFILAKIPDNNPISVFHFVGYGVDNFLSSTPRIYDGTWEVIIQIEGRAEKNGMSVDLVPIKFTILFKFVNSKLQPLDVRKHER